MVPSKSEPDFNKDLFIGTEDHYFGPIFRIEAVPSPSLVKWITSAAKVRDRGLGVSMPEMKIEQKVLAMEGRQGDRYEK